jgi:NADP-dependent 3-hydroxy acid dehydrogenase YdfG
MPAALVIGARNFGFAIIQRLLADGWSVTGGARSAETLDRVRDTGALALEVDVTDQGSVLAALGETADRFGGVDLAVNAASPYGGSRSGPFGGGQLAQASPAARFMIDQGREATIVQVTGGSSKRAMRGRGLWAAGAFGVRALTQAAALELREHRIHAALLVVDAMIDRSGSDDAHSADPASLADAVAYLASQSPRAMTHELQVTPALDNWTP